MRRSPDWRIWLGLSLTLGWLLLGAMYISSSIGWLNLDSLPADQLGNFLEGAFGPLAFLWLVIGYFLQQKELQQNTEALRQQSEQMAESVSHARQDTFLQISSNVRRQLGSISGFLFISSQSSDADGTVTTEEQSQMFAIQSAQDPELFSRRLLETHVRMEDSEQRYRLFYGTPVRARHSNNFIFNFERLMRRAEAIDPDNIARSYQQQAPEQLADHRITGIHIRLTNNQRNP